ncbi:MAG: protein kinase [Planctomycetota bacterium]
MRRCLTNAELLVVNLRSDDSVSLHLRKCAECRARRDGAQRDEELFAEIEGAYSTRSTTTLESPVVDAIDGYAIFNEIHRGGQGVVYRAEQLSTRRMVALKLLLKGRFATPREHHRFEREIELLASLKHPNIVTIHDSGVVDGQPYYAMELIDGCSLSEELRSVGAVSSRRELRGRLELFHTICLAVAHAHAHGAIHRDLKPQNILLDTERKPTVLDFGLAKAEREQAEPILLATAAGEFLGTLAYASPEQIKGDPDLVDARTDVYALGVILYEMLTGTLPYPVTGALSDVAHNIAETEPALPSQHSATIDDEVETLILTALSKDPHRRYASVAQLALDIKRYLTGRPIDAKRDSNWYVLRKALSRNIAVVTTVIAFALVITIGLVVAIAFAHSAAVQRDRANRESARAEARAYMATIAAADRSLRLFDARDAREQLGRAPIDLRDWEWHYLHARLDLSESSSENLTGKTIDDLTVTRDGTRVLAASADKSVRILDAMTLAELAVHRYSERPRVVAAGPSDTYAVGFERGGVELIEVSGGKLSRRLLGVEAVVQSIAVSPNGEFVAAGWGAFNSTSCGVHVWRPGTGEVLFTRATPHPVLGVAFSPDSTRLATSSLGVTVWDLTSSTEQRAWESHDSWTTDVAFDVTGERLVTASSDETVKVWDVESTKVLQVFRGHSNFLRAARFDADGSHVVSVGRDRTVRRWSVETGEAIATSWGHTEVILDVELLPSGEVLTCSQDGTVKRWAVDSEAADETVSWTAHENAIHAISFHPAGDIFATASGDKLVHVWRLDSGAKVGTLAGHEGPVFAAVFDPSGRFLATASADGTARVWDARSFEPLRTVVESENRVFSIAFTPKGNEVAAADEGGRVTITEVLSGEIVQTFQHKGCVHGLAYDSYGSRLACVGHQALSVWDPGTSTWTSSFAGANGPEAMPIAFGLDDRSLFAPTLQSTVRVIDTVNGSNPSVLGSVTETVSSIAQNPAGTRLSTASTGGEVRLWALPDGEPVSILLAGFSSYVNALTFDPAGRILVAGCYDGTVHLWNAPTLPSLEQEEAPK